MVLVDHELVHVPQPAVTVRMPVRLRAFPALVFVLMVLVVNVHMIMVHRLVNVLENTAVATRPQARRGQCRSEDDQGKDRERGGKAKGTPRPAGERIRDQPARVRQRELRRQQCPSGASAG